MGSIPDFRGLIEQKQKELSELKELFRNICEHPNMKNVDFCGDGG